MSKISARSPPGAASCGLKLPPIFRVDGEVFGRGAQPVETDSTYCASCPFRLQRRKNCSDSRRASTKNRRRNSSWIRTVVQKMAGKKLILFMIVS